MERYWANENENQKSLLQTISIISEKQMGQMFPYLPFQQQVPVLKDQIQP